MLIESAPGEWYWLCRRCGRASTFAAPDEEIARMDLAEHDRDVHLAARR